MTPPVTNNDNDNAIDNTIATHQNHLAEFDAAAIKAVWKHEKSLLKMDLKQIEYEYTQTIHSFDAKDKDKILEAKLFKHNQTMARVNQAVKNMNESEAMIKSEPSVRAKVEDIMPWIDFALFYIQTETNAKLGVEKERNPDFVID